MNNWPAVLGTGYAVPAQIRYNDDPIFSWLHQNSPAGTDLFRGYRERRVLDSHEDLIDMMLPAAQQAIEKARVTPDSIDFLIGFGSLSEFATPNVLAQVHQRLGLRDNVWVLPLNSEYTQVNEALLLADTLIKGGQARHVLVVCGCNWSRFVDYHTPQSISAADGAGALVMGLTSALDNFRLVDSMTEIQSQHFGVMYMRGDKVEAEQITAPTFHITPEGLNVFRNFGEHVPPALVTRLLQKHHLTGKDVSIIAHQTSAYLLEKWQQQIGARQFFHTLDTFANMTLASIPVNLAYFYDLIPTDYVVLLGIGVHIHASVSLLKRG